MKRASVHRRIGNLRALLQQRDLRQTDLARLLQVHRAQISRWCAHACIPAWHVQPLAAILGVPATDLLPAAPAPHDEIKAA